MSENYLLRIMSGNYRLRIMSGNYDLVYHHAEKLRFIGILAYLKTYYLQILYLLTLLENK